MRRTIGRRRLIVTADRGFGVDLARLLESFAVQFFIRVKHSTKVCVTLAVAAAQPDAL